MACLLQWNIRGLGANRPSLEILMNESRPGIVALQDTQSQDSKLYKFKGFQEYTKLNPTSKGGVATLISRQLLCSEVPLNTHLQAVATRVSLHRPITVCNVYLTPSQQINKTEIEELLDQLQAPVLLVGDFNAHSLLWDASCKPDSRGLSLEEIFNDRNLFVLNGEGPTYLHTANGTKSVLDLAICDPSISLDFDHVILQDTHGSDHFPILIKTPDNDMSSPERWILNKADWGSFSQACQDQITEETILSKPDPLKVFQEVLISVANQYVPRTKGQGRRVKVPWFDDQCKQARLNRRKAFRAFYREPSLANKISFNRAKSRARRCFKQAKKASWRSFVSQLNSRTPSAKVWKAIRKIGGKRQGHIQHLRVGTEQISDPKDIADTLAKNISNISSEERYSKEFAKTKREAEKIPLDFSSENSEDYNLPFSLHELKAALAGAGDTATGIDDIHYQFIKHLPEESLLVLLGIYNDIWESGDFPQSWREALVIPIPKPGKDHSNPNNYRPIALTSCVCKVMEKMINSRLMWVLEEKELLVKEQCGFRKGRSTTDHLVRLDTFVRETFGRGQVAVAVFFDLEKAYDTTWKYGIMRDLHRMGFRGRLPGFIEGFLEDRSFRTRVGVVTSDPFEQKQGVPQGSILSPALFNIKINEIVRDINNEIGEDFLFVDDLAIAARHNNYAGAARVVQNCIYRIESWVNQNGLKFSVEKTCCVNFRYKGTTFDPQLTLNGMPIRHVKNVRFLGVIFDERLTYAAHVENLKIECTKSLNLLRVLAHTDWGADRTVLLRLYRTLIRSKLDYGCIVYGGASRSTLAKLDPIHHQGLRLALGAFRTSPVESLCAEAGEMPLELRRKKLTLNYICRLKSVPANPAHKAVFVESGIMPKAHQIPLASRIKHDIREAEIDLEAIAKEHLTEEPPWTLQFPDVDLKLSGLKKDATNPVQYKTEFFMSMESRSTRTQVYTDGSKTEESVGCAAVIYESEKTNKRLLRLPDGSSVYTAEVNALNMAMKGIEKSNDKKFIILSDSLSALQALKGRNIDHHFMKKVILKYNKVIRQGKSVQLMWIPSHVGIKGNSHADRLAKEAATLTDNNTGKEIPASDLRARVNKYTQSLWQKEWDRVGPTNKRHSIASLLSDKLTSNRNNRREETVLSRLHIGHSYLTHAHLLKREAPPVCLGQGCKELLTMSHLLVGCDKLTSIRRRFYVADSMRSLFKNIRPERIFSFLKEIGVFNLI